MYITRLSQAWTAVYRPLLRAGHRADHDVTRDPLGLVSRCGYAQAQNNQASEVCRRVAARICILSSSPILK